MLRALADHLAGRRTDPEGEPEWGKICEIARMHQIGGILWRQCGDSIPQPFRMNLKREYDLACYVYLKHKNAWDSLPRAFQENGIRSFLIKGMGIAGYYPFLALRTMGDLDVVICGGARGQADSIMQGLGFRSLTHIEDREWQYEKDGLEYELHDRLVYSEKVTRSAHVKVFTNVS